MKRLWQTLAVATALLPACRPPEPTATVGPAGGTVVSADGRVRVAVPRGAVEREVTITIGRRGDCYELGPHGLAFAVPAEVTVAGPVDWHFSVLSLDAGGSRSVCTRAG